MDPVAFHIFSLPIRWYGVMAALGVVAAYLLIKKNRDYAGVTVEQSADITFMLILVGVIGSRLFYVIQFFDQFKYTYKNGVKIPLSSFGMLMEILKIWKGGLVFYGGFICAVIALIIYCRIKKINFWKVTDMCAPGLALGHAFGRIGCLLNGCCFGKPNAWGITYPADSIPGKCYPEQSLHPVQLYEALGNIGLAVLLHFTMRKLKPGQNLGLYLALYGVMRFTDEFLRGDHKEADLYFGTFTPAQFIGMFLIPIGVGLFIFFQVKPPVSEPAENIETKEKPDEIL